MMKLLALTVAAAFLGACGDGDSDSVTPRQQAQIEFSLWWDSLPIADQHSACDLVREVGAYNVVTEYVWTDPYEVAKELTAAC